MNPILKLSAIFAVWELAKLIAGRRRVLAAAKDNTGGCLVMMMEIPYAVWGIWLTFHDFNGAAVLWALTIISITAYIFSKEAEAKFYPFNCGMSIVALVAIFMGKL